MLKDARTWMRSYGKKGFTLVEIMIVVVIIGLLATMAIPAFNKVRQDSRDKVILNNLRQIASAGQQYLLENGTSSVGYSSLVGTYFSTISPVNNESYSGISIVPGGGTITVTQSDGRTVSYTY